MYPSQRRQYINIVFCLVRRPVAPAGGEKLITAVEHLDHMRSATPQASGLRASLSPHCSFLVSLLPHYRCCLALCSLLVPTLLYL